MKRVLVIAFSMAVAMGYAQKLTPQTEAFLHGDDITTESSNVRSRLLPARTSDKTFKAFITLSEASAAAKLADYGVKVGTSWDNYVTAVIPVDAVDALVALDEVKNIAIGNTVYPLTDAARSATNAEYVLTNANEDMPQPYTGKGVVVGVIDTGMEFNHLSFRDASDDTQTRIARVWDQNASSGTPPEGYDYGTEYSTPEQIRDLTYDNTTDIHGTHVTGIAAASKIDGCNYYGMAPESEIVFVSFRGTTVEVDIVDAVNYIFDYAESVGKPCVINMSLGSHQGPHDGTSVFDKFLSSVVGEGRIIVGACGNEGSGNQHISKTFTADDTDLKTTIGFASSTPSATILQVIGSVGSNLGVSMGIVDDDGTIVDIYGPVYADSNGGGVNLDQDKTGAKGYLLINSGYTSEHPSFLITSNVTSLESGHHVALFVSGEEGDEVHAWNLMGYSFATVNNEEYSDGDNDYTVGEIGGTSPDIISVGSYNSRNRAPVYNYTGLSYTGSFTVGTVSSFSSNGPTVDKRIKPDVLAPGQYVISSVNKNNNGESYWSTNCGNGYPRASACVTDSNGENYYYGFLQGTSMAAPCVAGIIAEWLEANPSLTPADILSIISTTSKELSDIDTYPNNQCGYGLIDAYKGVLSIIGDNENDDVYTGISEKAISANADAKVWADRQSGEIRCMSDTQATLTVTSLTGSTIGTYHLDSGLNSISIGRGFYIVTVTTPAATHTVKLSL